MGGARAEYKLNIAGSVARRRRDIFEIIHLGNMISLEKIMLLERFRNVPQAILNTKTTKFSGLRPDFMYLKQHFYVFKSRLFGLRPKTLLKLLNSYIYIYIYI